GSFPGMGGGYSQYMMRGMGGGGGAPGGPPAGMGGSMGGGSMGGPPAGSVPAAPAGGKAGGMLNPRNRGGGAETEERSPTRQTSAFAGRRRPAGLRMAEGP